MNLSNRYRILEVGYPCTLMKIIADSANAARHAAARFLQVSVQTLTAELY